MKKLRITLEGKVYDVQVEFLEEGEGDKNDVQAPRGVVSSGIKETPRAGAPSPAKQAAGGPGVVSSPLAGKVVSIDVAVGQKVKEGDQMLTLEAMKMNTFIYAPQDGTVASIAVTPGQAVEEGGLLANLS